MYSLVYSAHRGEGHEYLKFLRFPAMYAKIEVSINFWQNPNYILVYIDWTSLDASAGWAPIIVTLH